MDVIIQSLGFTAGESLESFIREKLLTLKFDKIIRAQVTLYLTSEASGENQVCEIRLEIPGNDHFVKKATTHFETSVTSCVDVLNKMINKARSKQEDRKKADATEIQDSIMEAEAEATGQIDLEDVVK